MDEQDDRGRATTRVSDADVSMTVVADLEALWSELAQTSKGYRQMQQPLLPGTHWYAARSLYDKIHAALLPPPALISSTIVDGATVSGQAVWTVVTLGDCATVEFWVDNVKVATDPAAAPFSTIVDTSKLANGAHHFGLALISSTGVRVTPQIGTVTVKNAVPFQVTVTGTAKVGQKLSAAITSKPG